MPPEPSAVEQAIARALRDNLATLQRSVTDLEQAVADLVAACSSSRPANALPPMLRAQTASASLEAALSVMARFLAASMQSSSAVAVAFPPSAELPAAAPAPVPRPAAPPAVPAEAAAAPAAETQRAAAEMVAEGAPVSAPEAAVAPPEPPAVAPPLEPAAEVPSPEPAWAAAEPEAAEAPAAEEEIIPTAAAEFDIAALSPEEQLLHRRANRVAKVSMQDIQMLHPEVVAQGREYRDICQRLREDIDKARREYDRRFQPILHHPVDYFYHWMVEILGNGDPSLLGEYPYPSPVGKR